LESILLVRRPKIFLQQYLPNSDIAAPTHFCSIRPSAPAPRPPPGSVNFAPTNPPPRLERKNSPAGLCRGHREGINGESRSCVRMRARGRVADVKRRPTAVSSITGPSIRIGLPSRQTCGGVPCVGSFCCSLPLL